MAMTMEERLASLEGSYQQVASRLDSIDRRLDSLEQRLSAEVGALQQRLSAEVGGLREEMHQRLAHLEQRFDHLEQRMHVQMYTLLGFMVATFSGLLAAIVTTR